MALIRLTDSEWQRIAPFVTPAPRKPGKAGRPPCPTRAIVEAIFWVLKTGARWRDIPPDYGVSQASAHRYHQRWSHDGTFRRIMETLGEELAREGVIDISESFIDGSFASAKKGGTS